MAPRTFTEPSVSPRLNAISFELSPRLSNSCCNKSNSLTVIRLLLLLSRMCAQHLDPHCKQKTPLRKLATRRLQCRERGVRPAVFTHVAVAREGVELLPL